MCELYFDFPLGDAARICVLHYERMSEVDHLSPEGAVPSHRHGFYEMVLILRGSCEHIYQGTSTMLLPGDLFLIPPHRAHAYRFYEDVDHFNCQFYADALAAEWLEDIQNLRYDRQRAFKPAAYHGLADINDQGILHLDNSQIVWLRETLTEIQTEQNAGRADGERMKRCLLQLALARLIRLSNQQFDTVNRQDQWKQALVEDALSSFERNLSGAVDIAQFVRSHHISEGYFRQIFKDVTGLPPRQYLNRMRVVRALEMLNVQGRDICETAEQVGIYDPNYFSRLCKKLTGYPPSHFQRRSK